MDLKRRYQRHADFSRLRRGKKFKGFLARIATALGSTGTPDNFVAIADALATTILTLTGNAVGKTKASGVLTLTNNAVAAAKAAAILTLAGNAVPGVKSSGVLTLTGNAVGEAKATEVLTLTGDPLDTETVVIGAKTYTFQTALTDFDGNVLIGATASDSIDNLIAAITLGAGAGSLYATSMTANLSATAAAGTGDTMDATALLAGVAGNSIVSTETLTNGSWGDTTFSSGTDNETVTIGSKVYTFEATLTNVDGNVLIGAAATDSIDNLIAAIVLGAGAGSLYASSTSVHPLVTAAAGTGDTMDITSLLTGVAGNSTATTETMTAGSFGGGTLASGTDDETVTLGGKTYTFEGTLTNVDGNVLIGAAATDSIDNLIAAITLDTGAGSLYAALTTAHPSVTAAAGTGDTMDVTALLAGTDGNALASTETMNAGSFAGGTLTGGVADETVTAGGKVYTFQAVLTNVDGNVLIGASASDSIDNLIAAITLGSGSGTLYAALTVANTSLTAAQGSGDTMDVTALLAGTAGNALGTTETMANGSFGGATLAGGTEDETVTLGSKTYTFQATLTNTDGNVLIGASASDSIDNLIAAIVLGAGFGTLYADLTTLNEDVTAAQGSGDTMDVTAIVFGTVGNALVSTETMTNGSFTGGTLASGVDGLMTAVANGISNSEGPYHLTTTSVLPLGLETGVDYWVNVIDNDDFTLSNSRGGPKTIVTSIGAGTHTLTKATVDHDVHALLDTNKSETIDAATDVDSLA